MCFGLGGRKGDFVGDSATSSYLPRKPYYHVRPGPPSHSSIVGIIKYICPSCKSKQIKSRPNAKPDPKLQMLCVQLRVNQYQVLNSISYRFCCMYLRGTNHRNGRPFKCERHKACLENRRREADICWVLKVGQSVELRRGAKVVFAIRMFTSCLSSEVHRCRDQSRKLDDQVSSGRTQPAEVSNKPHAASLEQYLRP